MDRAYTNQLASVLRRGLVGVMNSRTLLQHAQQQGPGSLQFFNPQLTMNEREKITESLLTGIKVKA